MYDTVIALDDNLDINEKAPIAISTVIVTNENILGMGSSGGNSNNKSFASFNEDNNLIISSNIYYVYNDNETYDVEDAIDVMLTKVGSEYKAEIIKYSNK